MAQTNKYIISDAIKRRLSQVDDLNEYVDALFKAAKAGNVTAIQEINNRVEGKVKETIDLTTSIKSLQPTQEEQINLDNKYKIQPIDIKADAIKSLPDAFNVEQISDNIDNIDAMRHNSDYQQPIEADKKTDTLPVQCTLNSGQDKTDNAGQDADSIAGQDTDSWYNKTPHLIYRNT